MQLESIKLENFRSWEKYDLDFSQTTILIGPNGAGKTNILEAVWFIGSGRSWRVRHEIELVNWGKDFARITAQINKDEKNIEIFLPKNPDLKTKQLKISGIKKRFTDLLGVMPVVLFSPESLQLVDGAPGLRRKFLDVVLSQIDHKYALTLLEYQKIVRERNKLLYLIKIKRSKPDELDFWDEKLVSLGSYIVEKRLELIKFFNKEITKSYQEISGEKEELKLKYHPSVELENFADILFVNRENEISQAVTTHGPHRDDFRIYLNNRDLSTFGSRGEYRSAILSMKILELKFMESQKKEQPILLLDDIFSELDFDRRMHLAKIVQDQQTIITTTDLDHIEKGLREKAKIVEIN